MENRFHATDAQFRKYTGVSIRKGVDENRISEKDGDLIQEFLSSILGKAERPISEKRLFHIASALVRLRDFFPVQYPDVTNSQLNKAMTEIKKPKPDGPFKHNTLSEYLRILKRFFFWMSEEGHNKIPEKSIKKYKIPGFDDGELKADDMLNEDEVNGMITACKNPRDRAIISMLASGGFRINELGTLTWGQVRIELDHLMITVTSRKGKKGEPITRTVPCDHIAKLSLINYMEYQGIINPPKTELVFFVQHGGVKMMMCYHNMLRLVQAAAKDAGVLKLDIEGKPKKIGCHLFRHTALSNMVNGGMGEILVKEVGWGNKSTNMIGRYIHPNEDTLLEAVRRAWGQEHEPEKPRAKKNYGPILCKCGEQNPPASRYCPKCGAGLSKDSVKDKQGVMKSLDTMMPNLTPDQLAMLAELVTKKMLEQGVKV